MAAINIRLGPCRAPSRNLGMRRRGASSSNKHPYIGGRTYRRSLNVAGAHHSPQCRGHGSGAAGFKRPHHPPRPGRRRCP